MSSVEKSAVSTDDRMRCFVCDVAVTGRYYILATCRTQTTRIRLIEKLGQLVGERYMVVISEDDVICRGCANLMNTLDRLETEMGSVRNVVLRFLEKKYSLDEGELLNNKATMLSQPPQVTPVSATRKAVASTENFMSRKRKAALLELENEREHPAAASSGKRTKADQKNDIWMQCDKCKYTTNLNSFMIHHIRQHVKKKSDLCDFCGDELKAGSCSNNCVAKKRTDAVQNGVAGSSGVGQAQRPIPVGVNGNHSKHPPKQFSDSVTRPSDSEAETVQMIAAELNEYASANRNSVSAESIVTSVASDNSQMSGHIGESVQSMLQGISQSTGNSTQISVENVSEMRGMETQLHSLTVNGSDSLGISASNIQQEGSNMRSEDVTLQAGSNENSAPTAICVMNMSEQNSAVEQTLLVQNMDDDNNAVYVQVVEVGKGDEVHDTSNMPKQVLTVADDGTVEMVEVMWNEMVSPHVSSAQDVHF